MILTSNPFQKHLKNIHTYMYPLPIYRTEILWASFNSNLQKCHRIMSFCNFICPPQHDFWDLSNTYRSHLLHFTDIQYSIVSIFHFVPDGHLSCFQLMSTTNHATVNSLVHYFLSIQTQSRIARYFSICHKECFPFPRS